MHDYIYRLGENNTRLYQLVREMKDLQTYLRGPQAETAGDAGRPPRAEGALHELWGLCLDQNELIAELEKTFIQLRDTLSGDSSGVVNAKSR